MAIESRGCSEKSIYGYLTSHSGLEYLEGKSTFWSEADVKQIWEK